MWRKEPVLILLAGADAASIAVLTALSALGVVSVDGTQLAAISAAIVAVTSLLGSIIRGQVVPVDVAGAREIEALFTPVPAVRHDSHYFDGDV